jgi:hypothetical protein
MEYYSKIDVLSESDTAASDESVDEYNESMLQFQALQKKQPTLIAKGSQPGVHDSIRANVSREMPWLEPKQKDYHIKQRKNGAKTYMNDYSRNCKVSIRNNYVILNENDSGNQITHVTDKKLLNIGSLNVCGLKRRSNFPDFIKLIENFDIFLVSETKLVKTDTIFVNGYTFVNNP